MQAGKQRTVVPLHVSHIVQNQAFPVFRVPESFEAKSFPICPGYGPRSLVPARNRGLSSEDAGLSGGLLPLLGSSFPGLLLVLPVTQGAGLASGLLRDGGSPAFHTDAQELGLFPSSLGAAPLQFLALWSLGPLAFVLASFLLPGFQLCWCRLDPRLRLPGLGRGLRRGLLPVGRLLFGLGFSGGCPAGGPGFLELSPVVGLLEGEAVDEYMSFRRVHPRAGGE